MDREERKDLILTYFDAYTSFDFGTMASLVNPDIIFKNVSAGGITAEAVEGFSYSRIHTEDIPVVLGEVFQRLN